jgi:hypothetical protein
MSEKIKIDLNEYKRFDRHFFDSSEEFTYIGEGFFGGKATGLAFIRKVLEEKFPGKKYKGITINVPTLTVLTTSVFDSFMSMNNLYDIAYSDESDENIAHAFQKANLPTDLVGDLRALISKVHTPLAVRSSSLLEDAMYEPFAGIYGTKMIPNNQFDIDSRFKKLTEAIKFVYSSTFFKEAKDYIKATKNKIEDEKMALIIQEVVGLRHTDRFYPNVSGVARSYNFYPMNRAKPEDGVVDLALGLGKIIVDGGSSWTYSPSYPRVKPPFGSDKEYLDKTQKYFWSVNMGKPPAYDPAKETEYMLYSEITEAEKDGTLNYVASTYDSNSDRMSPGISRIGPRAIDFYAILDLNLAPLNDLIQELLKVSHTSIESAIEMEFAVTFDENLENIRFGFLQVRPMVVSNEEIQIPDDEYDGINKILSSPFVLGNGEIDNISDIVFVKPEKFESKFTKQIAREIETINTNLVNQKNPYLLMGFGRWGSTDQWLGIPVNWGQISGSKVIVESMLPNMNVDLSQGSHFFHNITSFRVLYFSIQFSDSVKIDWDWINSNQTVSETEFVKHVKLSKPLLIKADGRLGKGVILK